MANQLFAGSRTKLWRAKKLISELEVALMEYEQSNRLTITYDAETVTAFYLEWEGMSLSIGAILGDAFHNLRAALDLMAAELARLNGKSDRDVYFPFAASETEFATSIRRKNFHRAGEDAIELLQRYAPYKGGNEQLRAIHDFDIKDKHVELLDTQKKADTQIQGSHKLQDSDKNRVVLKSHNIAHYFPKNSSLAGLPIIETLRELTKLIDEIIVAFTALVNKRTTAKDAVGNRKGG